MQKSGALRIKLSLLGLAVLYIFQRVAFFELGMVGEVTLGWLCIIMFLVICCDNVNHLGLFILFQGILVLCIQIGEKISVEMYVLYVSSDGLSRAVGQLMCFLETVVVILVTLVFLAIKLRDRTNNDV